MSSKLRMFTKILFIVKSCKNHNGKPQGGLELRKWM